MDINRNDGEHLGLRSVETYERLIFGKAGIHDEQGLVHIAYCLVFMLESQ